MTDLTTSSPAAEAETPRRREEPLTEDGLLVLCRLAREGVDIRTLCYAFSQPSFPLSEKTVRRLIKQNDWRVDPADAGAGR
jgi:hypothetical protein